MTLNRVYDRPILFLITLLAVTWFFVWAVPARGAEWRQAVGVREWSFPRDHGSHPDYRTEWWYFTGNLRDGHGDRYGYQLTFFRQGIRLEPADPDNPWSIRDLYLAHFAMTDVAAATFASKDLASRAGPGLAGASEDRMDVWLFDWSAAMEDSTIRIHARGADMHLTLELHPRKPPVFHGDGGLSAKGPAEGQASYYVSFTDLESRGVITTSARKSDIVVTGVSWFDHEFGSNQLTRDQAGWDWFSLHLSDGRDLMIYLLRRTDGSVEPASSGTLVNAAGHTQHLALSDIRIDVLATWKSPRSGGLYPVKWRLRVPSQAIELEVSALLNDQELITEASTNVVYWEGAVDGRGTSKGQAVTCEGYVELTGYAGSLGGVF